MQYPLPQFIEEEAKITFFLTFRQFFLLVGGAIVCFLLYYTVSFYVFITLSLFVMLIVSAIAFLKIDDEPIIKKLLHFINFYTEDKKYTWKKEDMPYSSKAVNSAPEPIKKPANQISKNNKNTEEYTYLKSSPTAPLLNIVTNTKTSKLNSAKKSIELKTK